MTAQRKLIAALLALLAVFVIGATGYYLIEGVPFGQAAYMTVITLSTVGHGEVWPLSPAGQMWTTAVIVFGILVVTLAFASLQAMIVGGELRGVMGRRKLKDRIGQLSGHTIVCGYGRMGSLIAEDLHRRGKKIVVIDRDERRTTAVGEVGLAYVLGDASDDDVLQEARIDRAAALVTVLHGDAENVIVSLTARGMRTEMPIIARAENVDSEPKLRRAGATKVICPQAIGAARVVNLLARPAIAHLVDITMGDQDWEIEEVLIQPDSRLVGKTLQDLHLRAEANITVVAVRTDDGKTSISPGPDHVVRAHDVMVVIGPSGAADSLAD